MSNESVLVVDDEESIREIFAEFLQIVGFSDIVTVASGVEALETLETRPFDIVFSDINMPEMKADVLVDRIIEKYDEKRPLIILLTGDTNTKVLTDHQGLNEKVDGILGKPFDEDTIAGALEDAKTSYQQKTLPA